MEDHSIYSLNLKKQGLEFQSEFCTLRFGQQNIKKYFFKLTFDVSLPDQVLIKNQESDYIS